MVDRAARNELALSLRLLVDGELTNDEFDDLYYERWMKHGDAGVRAIAEFGYGLYSSVDRYRLHGWNAVSDEIKEMAGRAVIFLQTDSDYCWPPRTSDLLASLAAMPWINLGIPLAVVAVLFAFMGFFIKDFPWWVIIALWGLVAIFFGGRTLARSRLRRNYEEWSQAGEIDAWPFSRQLDYYRARSGNSSHGCAGC
jgi:hypothetical protein